MNRQAEPLQDVDTNRLSNLLSGTGFLFPPPQPYLSFTSGGWKVIPVPTTRNHHYFFLCLLFVAGGALFLINARARWKEKGMVAGWRWRKCWTKGYMKESPAFSQAHRLSY